MKLQVASHELGLKTTFEKSNQILLTSLSIELYILQIYKIKASCHSCPSFFNILMGLTTRFSQQISSPQSD